MIRQFLTRCHPDFRPLTPRLYLPSVEHQEYVAGWRWGVICGATATALVAAIVSLV